MNYSPAELKAGLEYARLRYEYDTSGSFCEDEVEEWLKGPALKMPNAKFDIVGFYCWYLKYKSKNYSSEEEGDGLFAKIARALIAMWSL